MGFQIFSRARYCGIEKYCGKLWSSFNKLPSTAIQILRKEVLDQLRNALLALIADYRSQKIVTSKFVDVIHESRGLNSWQNF